MFLIQNVRFYNKVVLKTDLKDIDAFVLPMSIQLLAENAVKHNKISENQPLVLNIYADKAFLWLENGKNSKEIQEDSTGIGLKNLDARYRFMTGKSIVVENETALFRVGLPLIWD